MDFNWIWQTALIIITGIFFIRISGRRSISHMTTSQTILFISIGTLLIHPVMSKNIWVTFGTATVIVLTFLLSEYIQVKFNFFEKLLTGVATPVIENGQLNVQNLKKLKMTVDNLEMRLRIVSVTNISDVEYATIETNGELGYTLKQNKQPATKEDIQKLTTLINSYMSDLQPIISNQLLGTTTSNTNQNSPYSNQKIEQSTTDLFSEVINKENNPRPEKYLQ